MIEHTQNKHRIFRLYKHLFLTWHASHTHTHTHNYVHRFASARAEPPIDASQDITSASASLVDGVTTITFNRPRDSGDSSNDITLNVCRFFLFAFGGPVNFATQTAGYHGNMNRVASAERICIPTFAECSAGNC